MKNIFLMSYIKAIAVACLCAAFITIVLFGRFAVERDQKGGLVRNADEYMTLEDFNKATIPEALLAIENECTNKKEIYQNKEGKQIDRDSEACVSNEAQIKRLLRMQEFGLYDSNANNPSGEEAWLQLGKASLQHDEIKSYIKSILVIFSASAISIFFVFVLGRIYFKKSQDSVSIQGKADFENDLPALKTSVKEGSQVGSAADKSFAKSKIGGLLSSMLFGSLRLIRGFIGLIFVIQSSSLIMLSFQLPLHPIASSSGAKLLFGIVLTIVFGVIFFGLRWLINFLHLKIYGVSHPVFIKNNWAL